MSSRSQSPEGRWRIAETEIWDREALDLVVPAHITLGHDGMGEMQFIAISAEIDYRVDERDGAMVVEFSWAGYDERDQIFGRGWAKIVGGTMKGRLFIHMGDDSDFVAKFQPERRARSEAKRPRHKAASRKAQASKSTKGVSHGRS